MRFQMAKKKGKRSVICSFGYDVVPVKPDLLKASYLAYAVAVKESILLKTNSKKNCFFHEFDCKKNLILFSLFCVLKKNI